MPYETLDSALSDPIQADISSRIGQATRNDLRLRDTYSLCVSAKARAKQPVMGWMVTGGWEFACI